MGWPARTENCRYCTLGILEVDSGLSRHWLPLMLRRVESIFLNIVKKLLNLHLFNYMRSHTVYIYNSLYRLDVFFIYPSKTSLSLNLSLSLSLSPSLSLSFAVPKYPVTINLGSYSLI
jgi:hypothetical protein